MVLLVALWLALPAGAEQHPDFSGTWTLSSGERTVTLGISHHDPLFTVETTVVRGAGSQRHALQHYTIDGKSGISTGVDGDEFHTSIEWQDQSLVFTIMEHEDQRILPSKEIWTLVQNGAALQRVRERPDGKSQTLVYLRHP